MYGIDVDLIYAQIPFEKIETDFDIMDNEIIQWNKDKRSILALAGQLNKIQTTPPPPSPFIYKISHLKYKFIRLSVLYVERKSLKYTLKYASICN